MLVFKFKKKSIKDIIILTFVYLHIDKTYTKGLFVFYASLSISAFYYLHKST